MDGRSTGVPNVLTVVIGETISLMDTLWWLKLFLEHKAKQKQKAEQNGQEQPSNSADNNNQGSAKQGKSTLGSMHCVLANVSLPSVSALFRCAYVTFNDSSDEDSV